MHVHPTSSSKPRPSTLARIRNKIFIGVILATPLLATVWTFKVVLRLTTSWFPRALFPRLNSLCGGYLLQMLVLACVLLLFYLLGLFAHNFFGKRLYHLADRIFSGIPLVKSIYVFVRQVCEWVAKSRNTTFESVVLVEYPRPGAYTIGFVTSPALPAIASKILDAEGRPVECVNVFISTTPSPSNGMFIIFPKKDVIRLDMDVAEAMNLVISAGAILPQKAPEGEQNSMLEMIDNLIKRQDEENHAARRADGQP